jgi:nucleotide-binding universal stress UspA family protein
MEKIEKIVVACDLSKYTQQVINYASIVANQLKADLIIANVINQRDIEAIEYVVVKTLMVDKEISREDYIQKFKEDRLVQLKSHIEKTAHHHLFRKIMIKVGIPFQALIDVVQTEKADLLIMGSKGRSGIKDILIGATAERMFRFCPVPLLCVRLKNHEE